MGARLENTRERRGRGSCLSPLAGLARGPHTGTSHGGQCNRHEHPHCTDEEVEVPRGSGTCLSRASLAGALLGVLGPSGVAPEHRWFAAVGSCARWGGQGSFLRRKGSSAPSTARVWWGLGAGGHVLIVFLPTF